MTSNLNDSEYVGLSKNELPTPSLLLDLDVFEQNIKKMSDHSKRTGVHLRPHTKAHKCPEVARRQIEAGAIGVCAATINEAEAMVDAGIPGVLITSEMVGQEKVNRLVQLTLKQPELLSVVDDIVQANHLNEAASKANVMLNILIDIDPGLNRTGVEPGDNTITLAEGISNLSNLQLRGVQCYSGRSAHINGFEEREQHSKQSMQAGIETFHRLREMGYPMDILTGGSTGTYNIDTDLKGMTELQVGSYVFMDTDYTLIGGKAHANYDDFSVSLSILSTVVSQNHKNIATIDAGLKAMATDRSFLPVLKEMEGATFQFSGDEHGRLEYDDTHINISLGDRVEIIPPHIDPTVNLYSHIFCIRNNKVESVWPIVGRH